MRMLFIAVALALGVLSAGRAAAGQTETITAIERFSVHVQGEGPDVILIPGLASSDRIWNETAARLKAHHRIHTIWVSGFAGNIGRANATGPVVAPIAEALATYIAERKLRAPAVIGHSMGGEIALMLAARHPARVGRVMVVDALPFYSLLFDPAATPEGVRPRAAAFRDTTIAQTPEQAAARAAGVAARLVKTDAERSRVIADSAASDRRVVAGAIYDLMTTDLRPELPRISVPLTVLYAYDRAYGVPAAQIDALFGGAYKTAPTARLERIDDSFHFIMADQPARFAEAVTRFLR